MRALGIAAFVWSSACGCASSCDGPSSGGARDRGTSSEERARAEREPRREDSEAVDPRYRARCALGEETILARGLPGVRSLAIAIGDTSRLVLLDRDPGTLLAIAARPVAGAAPEPIELPGADALLALEPIDGERFVAIGRAPCAETEDTSAASRCLAARVIGADAHALSAVETLALPSPMRSVRVDASGDSVWIARASPGSQPALDRLAAGESSLAITTRALGEGIDVSEEPTEILGLAVSGGSWAVIWRHGATEDARSGVLLSTQLDEHQVEALHEALVLDSFQWYAGALSAIAAFEFARPSFVRLGADGEVRGGPRPLPPGEPLPQPFRSRRVAAIVGTGANAAVEVRDGAGDAIAPRVSIAGALRADVARDGDAFVLALARREDDGVAIVTRELRCESTTSAPSEDD